MVASSRASGCLGEDDVLAFASGARSIGDEPTVETHLAACSVCSALVANAMRGARVWNALTGSQLGPYRIESQIGAGGMGAVYRAIDTRLGRAVALKVLHEESRRLVAEARAAAAIDHPAVVRIHDVGTVDGVSYVAMELIEGESVRALLRNGPLDRAPAIIRELVDAVAAAHARGVIHRDLKPENLVVSRGGLRILDFGLAKVTAGDVIDETQPGVVQGTAAYMAPEQARGEVVDARADIFAIGAIAFELTTGQRAFPGATNADRLSATLRDTPPTEDAVISRCLAKDPNDRFQTAADLAWALRHERADTPTRPSRRGFLIGALAAGGTAVAGYLLGARRHSVERTVTLRPLTHRNGRVYTARFSRDGARIVYGAQWDDGPLQIHAADGATGETTLLELPAGDVLALSARGELAVALGLRFIDHQSARGNLALVPLAGGIPRALADDIQEADFAPDGPVPGSPEGEAGKVPSGSLVVVRPLEHGFRIELPLGTALVEEPGWITHPRVSPDGRHIAYLRHPNTDDDSGELVIVDVATRARRVVSTGWMSIAGVAWDAQGDALWFTASRDSLQNKLRRVTLAGDLRDVAVPSAGRLRLHDIDASHRALVTLDSWRLRARAGDHDRSQSNISWVSDLSRDGSQLLLGELGYTETGPGAYLVPYTGGRALRLGPGFPVAISPSGQLVAANVNDTDRLVVYAVGSGEMPTIPAPGFVVFARWIDERSLIGLYKEQLWRLTVGSPPVRIADTGGRFAIDATRGRCAYITKAGELRVLELATSRATVLAHDVHHQEVCGWLTEQDGILVCSMTTPIVVDRIDPASGARTRHTELVPPPLGLKAVDSVVFTPDGAHHAYSYGQELSVLVLATGLG